MKNKNIHNAQMGLGFHAEMAAWDYLKAKRYEESTLSEKPEVKLKDAKRVWEFTQKLTRQIRENGF